MDIEKLIEQLQNAAGGPDGVKMCQQAATALSTLQAENEKLREKIEEACLEGYVKGLGEMSEENERLWAELEQAKAERDAAIEDIDSMLAKAELIRRKIGYCLDYDSDAELASLCVDYCKNNVCEMCYEEREDGGCGNFLWRGQKEN